MCKQNCVHTNDRINLTGSWSKISVKRQPAMSHAHAIYTISTVVMLISVLFVNRMLLPKLY